MTIFNPEVSRRTFKIAIIAMGGTIAMVPGKNGALVPLQSAAELLDAVPLLRELADFEVVDLANLDSTNIEPEHWSQLSMKIAEIYQKFDAFIITHGTDTMAETSTALSFALGHTLAKPVVFTGSQLPMIEPGNDARSNMEDAAKVAVAAIEQHIAEVMITFNHRAFRANRTVKISESRFDAFDSPAFPPLATITATDLVFIPQSNHAPEFAMPTIEPISDFARVVETRELGPETEAGKLLPSMLDDQGQPLGKVLVLRSLGAGNIPDRFIPEIRKLHELGVAIFVATKFLGGQTNSTMYETGMQALEAGACPTSDATEVAIRIKAMWVAANLGTDDIYELQKRVVTDYMGELTSVKQSVIDHLKIN